MNPLAPRAALPPRSVAVRTLALLNRYRGISAFTLLSTVAFAASADLVQASGLHTARIPASFRSWELEDPESGVTAKLTQIHVPVVGSVRLGEAVDLVVSSAYGSSTLEPPSGDGTATVSDLSMSGNGDVKSQLFVRLFEDRFLVQGGISAPAGTKGLDAEQLSVVQALGNPLLGFRMKHYGEGLDLSGGAAFAVPLGNVATAAAGAGFVTRGEYEFVEGEPDFKPGQETSVSAGIDFVAEGARPAVRLDASYRIFGADQLDGEDIFQEGNQLELQAVTGFRPGRARVDLAGRIVLKDDNEVFDPQGDDVEKIAMDAGTAIYFQAETGLEFSGGFFGAQANLIQFDGGETSAEGSSEATPSSSGTAYGVGPVLEFALGSNGRIRLGGQYLLGTIDGETQEDGTTVGEIDLTGFDATLSLTWAQGAR